jgi:uncharacterized phiE125 gp8 family phage protein
MGATLVTAPAVEPVTLAQAKAHCRVDISEDDALISGLITAARMFIEGQTHRALITQTWDFTFDEFPCESLRLPMAPVSDVTNISYVDTNGDTQTLLGSPALTDFRSVLNTDTPYLVPLYDESWPDTRCQPNAVTVRAVCGYGTARRIVPAPLSHALLLLVAHWYEHREAAALGGTSEVPFAVEALISPYRRNTFGR